MGHYIYKISDTVNNRINVKSLASSIKEQLNGYEYMNVEKELVYIFFENEIDQTILDKIITTHTAEQDKKAKVYLYYKAYKKDGIKYADEYRAKRVTQVFDGEITEDELFDEEDHLEVVSSRIVNGDWKSALKKLADIEPLGIFTQAVKDQLTSDITNYIAKYKQL